MLLENSYRNASLMSYRQHFYVTGRNDETVNAMDLIKGDTCHSLFTLDRHIPKLVLPQNKVVGDLQSIAQR